MDIMIKNLSVFAHETSNDIRILINDSDASNRNTRITSLALKTAGVFLAVITLPMLAGALTLVTGGFFHGVGCLAFATLSASLSYDCIKIGTTLSRSLKANIQNAARNILGSNSMTSTLTDTLVVGIVYDYALKNRLIIQQAV